MKHYVVSFFTQSVDYGKLIKEQSQVSAPNAMYQPKCKR